MASTGRAVRLVVVLALLGGCGGPPDAPDAGSPDAGAAVGVVTDPAPPVLGPCPAGWRAVDADGLSTCDPWPVTGRRTDCAFDEAQFPGGTDCERVGTACPADGWPAGLPTDRPIVYVDDGAAAGGDGTTRALAFRTLADAVHATPAPPPRSVFAMATGHYDESNVEIPADDTVWGACVSGTRLTSTMANEQGVVIDLANDGAGVRNLSIDAPRRMGLGASGRGATIDDVVVSHAAPCAVVTDSPDLRIHRLVARDTQPHSTGFLGHGLHAFAGAHVTVAQSVFERNHDAALFAAQDGAATIDATDVALVDTAVRPNDGAGGHGAHAEAGSTITLTRVAVEGCAGAGVLSVDAGSVVTATDVLVRGTTESGDLPESRGVGAQLGGRLVLARVVVEQSTDIGLLVDGAASTADVQDLLVRDSHAGVDELLGRGVQVSGGARATLARVVVLRATDIGVFDVQPGSTLDLSDAVIADTVGDVRGYASGLQVEGGTTTLARARVAGGRSVGVLVTGMNASLDATDLHVLDTLPSALDGQGGVGVFAQDHAHLALRTARVERTRFVALGVDNHADAVFDDVFVSDVAASDCGATTCPDFAGGFGISAHYGATVHVTGFGIESAALCGVVVGANSAGGALTGLDLAMGAIDGAPVGACVQVDGYDTARLRHEVVYRRVGIPLQATSYMLPGMLGG